MEFVDKLKSMFVRFILLVNLLFSQRALAQTIELRPFSCELKSELTLTQLKALPVAEQQWLLLLGVSQFDQFDPSSAQSGGLGLEDQFFEPLKRVAALVKNCQSGLQFWARQGRAMIAYFDSLKRLAIKLTPQVQSSLFFSELSIRDKIILRPTSYQAFDLSIEQVPFNGTRPWWKVEIKDNGDHSARALYHYSLSQGPLGALTSYELIRQIDLNYSYYFETNALMLSSQKVQELSESFPKLSILFELIHKLPRRESLSKGIQIFFNSVLALLLLIIILRVYLQKTRNKHK